MDLSGESMDLQIFAKYRVGTVWGLNGERFKQNMKGAAVEDL